MHFANFFVPLAVLLAAFFLGIVYFDRKPGTDLVDEFSFNLKKWHTKGNFFLYRGVYKIFYVFEPISVESATADQKHSGDEAWPKVSQETTILFLHGFPTSSYDYFKVWNLFTSANYNQHSSINSKYTSVLTLDFLGYGFSDKPDNYEYSVFDMADLVDNLLTHLRIDKVAIVAHDIGDTVAQEVIRRDNLKNQNHFQIDKCVLLNGGVFTDIYKSLLAQDVLRSTAFKLVFSKFFFRYHIFEWAFGRIFGSLNRPNSTDMYDFYLGIRYNFGNEILPLTIGYMSEREQYGEVWRDALNETVLPLEFIYGPADPINPRSKFPAKMREELPNIKLNILSDLVGHYPQYEDPFTVYELIKQFFK